jgi:hypothetical protein
MPVNLSDRISGVEPRGSVAVAINYARRVGAAFAAGTMAGGGRNPTFLVDYFTELYRLCALLKFDFAILTGQWKNETAAGAAWNDNWEILGNPAGLAITNSENKSQVYQNGIDAARAHMVHMWIYTRGALKPGDYLYQWRNLDGHYIEAAEGRNPYSGLNEPYAGSVKTVGDLNVPGRWALLFDDAGNKLPIYGTRVRNDANAMWPNLPDQGSVTIPPTEPEQPMPDPVDTSKLITGRVPMPPVIDRIVSKPVVRSGYGYDQCPPRDIIATCTHEWQGSGRETIDFVATFFGPSGERYTNALVDVATMPDGRLVLLNDPFGTRAPWANGGGVESGGLEGDGVFFYNKFGLGAINTRITSNEIVKSDSAQYTAEQIAAAGAWNAWIHDRDGHFYTEFPYVSMYGGVMDYLHFEFGTTNCGVGEQDDITKVQAVAKGIMQKYQTNASGPSVPNDPEVPPLPDPELPAGIPLSVAKARFGSVRKIDAKTGKVLSIGGFDPRGVISLGWARRCADVFGEDFDKWPAGGDWITDTEAIDRDRIDLITFDRSPWTMFRANEKAGFDWVK